MGKWVKGFFKRNSGVAERLSQQIEACRLIAMNPPAIWRFYDIAGYALTVNDPPKEVIPGRRYRLTKLAEGIRSGGSRGRGRCGSACHLLP